MGRYSHFRFAHISRIAMNIHPVKQQDKETTGVILGCMGFGGDKDEHLSAYIAPAFHAFDVAHDSGIGMFDHADIYRDGRAEKLFGEWLRLHPGLRESLIIQSKCGIRMGRYDFSESHIIESAEGVLKRLQTDYLDVLLLHRPDPLIDPEAVGRAFARLRETGKVRYFGVSNMNVPQIRYLQAALPDPLIATQMEMSLGHLDWLDTGVQVNRPDGAACCFPEGLLEYCRSERMHIQAWGALAQGRFSGKSQDSAPATVRHTVDKVRYFAQHWQTSPESVVLGWLMRHPARIQPVIGTTHPQRIGACADAAKVAAQMSADEWYDLYVCARGRPLP
jgi:predicted oxidoreductase